MNDPQNQNPQHPACVSLRVDKWSGEANKTIAWQNGYSEIVKPLLFDYS